MRAAVLIGVGKVGHLPRLRATTRGVRQMEAWALAQGMPRELVRVVTDEAGPVDVSQIKQAVRQLVDLAAVDQLVVYFAGHGVNIGYAERWLLSDAPNDSDAAVNVEGAITAARWCRIPHVVLVSDACRTAAEGIQAQGIRGSDLFPNDGPEGLEQAVDAFFACSLGKPAYEIRDPAESARLFRAVYTDVLAGALGGEPADLVDEEPEREPRSGLIRPWPLKRHLQAAVPKQLAASGVAATVWQTPDARICSDENAWISRISLPPDFPTGRRGELVTPPDTSLPAIAEALLSDSLARGSVRLDPWRLPGGPDEQALNQAINQLAEPPDPRTLDLDCGFALRGGSFAYPKPAGQAAAARLAGRDLVRVDELRGPAVPVLLRFDDGNAAVLPAINGYVATLTRTDGQLVDVAYEPSGRSPQRLGFWEHADGHRGLRALLAATADLGVLRLDARSAENLARQVRAPGRGRIDPTMALYAAYAFNELRQRPAIAGMATELREQIGVEPFDIALLGGYHAGRPLDAEAGVAPFVPLLSRGWALLAAHGATLPPDLAGIERCLVPSLWTLFNEAGADRLHATLARGELR